MTSQWMLVCALFTLAPLVALLMDVALVGLLESRADKCCRDYGNVSLVCGGFDALPSAFSLVKVVLTIDSIFVLLSFGLYYVMFRRIAMPLKSPLGVAYMVTVVIRCVIPAFMYGVFHTIESVQGDTVCALNIDSGALVVGLLLVMCLGGAQAGTLASFSDEFLYHVRPPLQRPKLKKVTILAPVSQVDPETMGSEEHDVMVLPEA